MNPIIYDDRKRNHLFSLIVNLCCLLVPIQRLNVYKFISIFFLDFLRLGLNVLH